MDKNYARDLFQLQSELVDKKVDMAVAHAIDRVMDELGSMRKDMQSMKHDLHKDMNSIKLDVHKDMHSIKHDLHAEIHVFKRDMDNQFSGLKERVTAVESTLTYVKNSQTQINTKFMDYTFKAGWLILGGSVSYVLARFFGLIG